MLNEKRLLNYKKKKLSSIIFEQKTLIRIGGNTVSIILSYFMT